MDTVISTLKQPSLLQAVLEGFIDGILILTDQGEWLHANDRARHICHQLAETASPNRVPQEIWKACQALIDSLNWYPDCTLLIEDEIRSQAAVTYRVRAQWLTIDSVGRPCVLITLEDRYQSLRNLAIAEGQRYGLTPREAEVWLRYRANYSYKDIAAELYITQNTVKKHMKSILAKRQIVQHSDE